MNKQVKADLMLLLVTLGWGASYYLIDISLGEISSFTLNALRFLIAFTLCVFFSYKKLLSVTKDTLKYSLSLGVLLVFIYMGATFGIKYTTLSNATFLCGLTVVFTPVLSSLIYRKAPEKKLIITILMSFAGVALLTLKEDFSINFTNLKGDLLSIMCASFYAIHLLTTEKAVKNENVDHYHLGVFQLMVAGVLNLFLAFVFEKPKLPVSMVVWNSVLFLSVFCTGIAFIVQATAQRYTSASHVGVIFSMETVFAGILAYVLGNEVLTLKSYFGAFIMISSIFVMEIDFNTL